MRTLIMKNVNVLLFVLVTAAVFAQPGGGGGQPGGGQPPGTGAPIDGSEVVIVIGAAAFAYIKLKGQYTVKTIRR